MRYIPAISLALLTDGLQAVFAAGLLAAGSAASAATAGIGAPIILPLAIGLGFAIDICISATFGAGLLLLLANNDMFYMGYAFGGGVFELIPGFDVLPGWTAMTILCIVRKMGEEGQLKGVGGKLLSAAVAGSNVAGAVAGIASGSAQNGGATKSAGVLAQNNQEKTSSGQGHNVHTELKKH